MARAKRELTLAEVDAIVLPHGGTRPSFRAEKIIDRAPYYSNGPRGRACCLHVFSGERWDIRGHRCGKIAAVTETVPDKGDRDFCGFHSTPQMQKREAVQAAKDAAARAKWAEAAERRRMAEQAPTWRDALQKIADGDNDPRETARIALGLTQPPETY